MSKRRILTAKEQYELLTPWRKHADDTGLSQLKKNKNPALPSNWEELMKAPVMGRDWPPKQENLSDPNACPTCKGKGSKSRYICTDCFGEGTVSQHDPGDMSANDILSNPLVEGEDPHPAGQKLERSLYKEFMDWWPESEAAKKRLPMLEEGSIGTNWGEFPNEPITHWLNVEDFLNERYPDSATGSRFGYEGAGPALEMGVNGAESWDHDEQKYTRVPVKPEDLERWGWSGTGNAVTQAMLNLHNKLQGRSWASRNDYQRYMELMLRHIGPGARRLARLVFASRFARLRKSSSDRHDFADFFQWCAEEHLRPNRASLGLYAQFSGMTSGEYTNLSSLISDMGFDGQSLEFLRAASRRFWAADSPYKIPGTEHNLSETVYSGDGPMTEAHHGGYAEYHLKQRGMNGKTFHVPSAHKDIPQDAENRYGLIQKLQRQHSAEAEQYARNVLEKNGLPDDSVRIEPEDWDTRASGALASYQRATNKIGLEGNHIDELTLLHELAHKLTDTTHINYHGHEFKQTLHGLIHQNLGEKAGTSYGNLGFLDQNPYQLALPLFTRNASRKFWAMPGVDAYDKGIPHNERPQEDPEIPTGPWYHAADHDLTDGTILTPGGGPSKWNHVYRGDRANRADWVWLSQHPEDAQIWGKQVYEVEPHEEGPWPWNGDPYQYVAPRARVVRKLDPSEVPTSFREGQRFWAMADTTKWHPMIQHKSKPAKKDTYYSPATGTYHINIGNQRIGDLQYIAYDKGDMYHPSSGTLPKPRPYSEALIDSLIVHPEYRNQGVAQALVERLAQDHPEHKINPGTTTPMGNGFTERLRKIIPEAEDRIKPDYDAFTVDDEDGESWENHQLDRLLTSRRFWAGPPPAEDAYDPNPHPAHSSPTSNPYRENKSGKWYHVSPHKMEAGTVLSPGGGESSYAYNDTTMPQGRQDWVWMDGPEGLKTWYYGTLLSQIKNGVENPWAYIYEVEPSEGPHPWNGTGWEGHAAPSAKILREIETDKYNRLPDISKLALKYEVPEGISVTNHGPLNARGLGKEVLNQDGPAILWQAFQQPFPGDKYYVARGQDGTIHGVLKGLESKSHFHVTDLYSSLKAPPGTGNQLLRTVAQEAKNKGKGLAVMHMVNNARPYWESMGAQTKDDNAHADWSPEGLQALIDGDSIVSPSTSAHAINMNQPIPRAHRLPGSAREIAWGKRKQKSAGKRGELPEGIAFTHGKMWDGRDAVQAHIGDKLVGQLQWNSNAAKRGFQNDINYITVHPEYRRRGIGTAMYNHAVQNVDPTLLPGSTDVTPSGKALSQSLGYKPGDYGSYMDGVPWGFQLKPVRDDGNDWPDAAIGNGWQWNEKFNHRSKDRFAFWHAKD